LVTINKITWSDELQEFLLHVSLVISGKLESALESSSWHGLLSFFEVSLKGTDKSESEQVLSPSPS